MFCFACFLFFFFLFVFDKLCFAVNIFILQKMKLQNHITRLINGHFGKKRQRQTKNGTQEKEAKENKKKSLEKKRFNVILMIK